MRRAMFEGHFVQELRKGKKASPLDNTNEGLLGWVLGVKSLMEDYGGWVSLFYFQGSGKMGKVKFS